MEIEILMLVLVAGITITCLCFCCCFWGWGWCWACLLWSWSNSRSKCKSQEGNGNVNNKNTNGDSPKAWPLIGCAVEHLLNYDRMHDWLLSYLCCSKTITVVMPFTTYTYTVDPANVEYILKTHFSNFPKGEAYRHCMRDLLGDGIFNADGETWKKQRKTASLEFSSRNLREFSTLVFRDYAVKLALILSRMSLYEQYVDIQELFMRMTLDSICKVGFGVEIGTLDLRMPENPFAKAFDIANEVVTLRFIDPVWKMKRFFKVGSEALMDTSISIVNNFTYSVISKRKAEIEHAQASGTQSQEKPDLLSRFIELGNVPESKLTDENLRDIVLNFVIAGRDTTASALSWFVYIMTKHPIMAAKLHKELCELEQQRAREEGVELMELVSPEQDINAFNARIVQFAQLLNYDSLNKLQFLYATISEILRLYPPVPQDPKGILEDDVLPDGTALRKGGMVTYVPYSMGRMVDLWGHDASEFKPERWLNEQGAINPQHISPFKFTAFQAGPRICLGRDSAYLQLKISTAILCRFFKFELLPHHPVQYRMMTILSMAHGLKVFISPHV